MLSGKMTTKARRTSIKRMIMMMIVSPLLNMVIFFLCDYESINPVIDESVWIIDSDVTLHITPRKDFFTSYTFGDFRVLKMDNGGVFKVIDVGDVCLQTHMRMHLFLKGFKHAHDVHFNLILVHMLDDGG